MSRYPAVAKKWNTHQPGSAVLLIIVCLFGLQSAQAQTGGLPALPLAVTNNAVVLLEREQGIELFSFAGLLEPKDWQAVSSKAWWLPPKAQQWQTLPDVPGEQGRLASAAVAVGDSVWLFGGYTVAADGSERSTPETFKVNPRHQPVYQRKADMPVPVDDMLAVVYKDRYIYLISGWHDVGNVNLVQIYDTATDQWQQGTPYPGAAVFGHGGGLVGAQLLVCGGVAINYPATGPRSFAASEGCWLGRISEDDHRRINWRPVSEMPGPARYRTAATGVVDSSRVVFIGGSDNPYNYNGIGYNGNPSEPIGEIVSFNLDSLTWQCHGVMATPSMDHRGLLVQDRYLLTLGGMRSGQQMTDALVKHKLGVGKDCD